MTKTKQTHLYQRILSASQFMTRSSQQDIYNDNQCENTRQEEDQLTLCDTPKTVFGFDEDQTTLYDDEKHTRDSCLTEDDGSDDSDDDEEDYMNEILSSYASTLDKLSGTETVPAATRNTAVLIVLSPHALTAGNIARQRRRNHKFAA
ncbi:hypothetical protein BY458DRAFT_515562 [Sporodiniella umbellata]|nr:hypothetical protein BY458DRAFT_515562 [Sporodiniella umbellata]